jgi:hypothetical protein
VPAGNPLHIAGGQEVEFESGQPDQEVQVSFGEALSDASIRHTQMPESPWPA